MAPVSDLAALSEPISATPDNLICPASAIYDAPVIEAALHAAVSKAKDAREIRAATVADRKSVV